MPSDDTNPSGPIVPKQESKGRFLAARSSAYIAIVLAVVLGACIYSLLKYGIFNCQASGYGSDRYLAYCGATNYGDYDHGVFWYGLEPSATDAATNAQVLFIGNSRMQFGLSTDATATWSASLPVHYYLLGFSHNENYTFEAPLLNKLRPKAKVYVVNLDLFFEQSESQPGKTVMRDSGAKSRYEQKRLWQYVHKPICSRLPAACANGAAFFRSRATGAWVVTGGRFTSKPASFDESVDERVVKSYTTAGKAFLSSLPVRRECVILTMVPTVNTPIGTAKAVAANLGMTLIAPELPGLNTFDESHLDRQSAQRWSAAFIEAADPRIRECLDQSLHSRLQPQMR